LSPQLPSAAPRVRATPGSERPSSLLRRHPVPSSLALPAASLRSPTGPSDPP
ncbi:hypothetical protein KUCAC02_030896, partial [Chaenocephalus aceratus]